MKPKVDQTLGEIEESIVDDERKYEKDRRLRKATGEVLKELSLELDNLKRQVRAESGNLPHNHRS